MVVEVKLEPDDEMEEIVVEADAEACRQDHQLTTIDLPVNPFLYFKDLFRSLDNMPYVNNLMRLLELLLLRV